MLSLLCLISLVVARPFSHRSAAQSYQIRASTPLGDENNARYVVNATVNGQSLTALLDTGSSTTYFFSSEPPLTSGQAAVPLLDASNLPSANASFSANYGYGSGMTFDQGPVVLASLGFENTSLTLNSFPIAAITNASSLDSALVSGLIGLGFAIQNAESLNFSSQTTYIQANPGQIPPASITVQSYTIVQSLYAQGLISAPFFALSLGRVPANASEPTLVFQNGTFDIGTYPSGTQEADFVFSNAPLIDLSTAEVQAAFGGLNLISYGFPQMSPITWTILVEAVYFNGTLLQPSKMLPNSTTENAQFALVDSGNGGLAMPPDVLSQFTTAYTSNPNGATVPCNTIVTIEFQFNGTRFGISQVDLIGPAATGTDCVYNIDSLAPSADSYGVNTSQSFALGDIFLRNVISVFDYGSLDGSLPPRIGFKVA